MDKIVLPEIVALGVYDASAVFSGTVTKNRKVSMYEIEQPLENGGISFTDDLKTDITTDLIICAKPGQQRHTQLPFRSLYVHMILEDGILSGILKKTPTYFRTKQPERYRKIFSDLCRLYDTGLEFDTVLLQSRMLELIYTIRLDAANILKDGLKTKGDLLIEKAVDFINDNFQRSISLDEIAESVSLSPIYFHNRFKKATGKTPHEYITEKRIKKAVNMLMTTNMSHAEIAYECGFSSQSYFNSAFKKSMGFSPRDYMRMVYEKYEQ